jgi:hypothetical protein
VAAQLPANVNLSTLLALAPLAAPVGGEPIESVQGGTSGAFTVNQIVAFAKASHTTVGLSVLGVAGTSNAAVAAITGLGDQVLRVNSAGASLAFGAVNLATSAAVTGVLSVPSGGSGTSTLTGLVVGSGTSAFTTAIYVAAGTWTPADASGAGLTFTNVTASYSQIGNMVFAYGRFTFPNTSNTANIVISGLPVVAAASLYTQSPSCALAAASGTAVVAIPVANSTTFNIITAIGAIVLKNASTSTGAVIVNIAYPAA